LIDKVKVKGKDKAVKIYEPMCRTADATLELRDSIEEYEKALNCYFNKNWDTAQTQFEALQQKFPQALLYKIYLERIESLRHEILPEDWDGSYQHMSK
jgi:adenylate cyclase